MRDVVEHEGEVSYFSSFSRLPFSSLSGFGEAIITKLVQALEPWTGAARRVRKSSKRSTQRRSHEGPSTNDVRNWARAQGHEVSDRGRIPSAIMAAYEAAH